MRNKLLKLNVFALLLVSIFTLFFTVSCKDKDKFVDQGEVGKYYSFVNENELCLDLDQNKFTFTGLENELTGKYTFDGTNLVITFKDDNASVAVNYQDDKLMFAYKGNNYTLYRNVNYTVDFNAAGGSEVIDLSVQAGRKVAEPVNPTKDGYTFVGWYKDQLYQNVYNFNKEIVTGDITLYARFEQNTDSFNEFKVNYYTGVGGVAFDDVTTLNNTVYILPEVEVEGKTFVGWWVSDYNDASKLTYQYKAGMELYQDTTLYAVYKNDGVNITVEDDFVSWDSKGNTATYALNIRDANDLEEVVYTNGTVRTNSQAYDFSQLPAGNYVVEVIYKNTTSKAYFCNKGLNQVSNFKVTGNVLTWNAVPNAQKYKLTINCGNPAHNHKSVEVTGCQYDFTECTMPADGIDFKVEAVADGYYNSTSLVYNVYRELDYVTNVKLDKVSGKPVITWDAVEGAQGYNVKVVKTGDVKNYTVETNSFDASELYGSFTFVVTPVCAGYYGFTSSNNLNKTQLAVPGNISIYGYEVRWDAVEDAASYKLVIGTTEYTSNTNSYTLTQQEVAQFEQFNIKVQAIAADANNNSEFSNIAQINKAGIETITYSNGVIAWNAVPGIVKYAVKVDDGDVELVDNAVQLAKVITDGNHKISVAVADAAGNHGKFTDYNVTLYKLAFDANGGDDVADRYFTVNDTVGELPQAERLGYSFTGWYLNNEPYTKSTLDQASNMTLVAQWVGNAITVTFDYGIGNGTKTTQNVVFGSAYTFDVPECTSTIKAFAGWYSDANGAGTRLTNENGESTSKWKLYFETTAYAYYVDIFTFTLVNNGQAYAVSKGPGIGYVSEITIPTTYNELPVTTVESSGFASCTTLVTINIPQTIVNVETGAQGPNGTGNCFAGCTKLQNVFVYEVEGAVAADVKYYDVDGVLIYKNEFNGVELKYFPYNTRTGTYRIPDSVTTIPTNAFRSCSKLTEIIVPASVTKIDDSAFYLCSKLTGITFESAGEGVTEKELVIGAKVFQSNSALVTINLPARLGSFSVDVFTSCSALSYVNIVGEFEGQKYSSNDGVLFTADHTELLYYPKGRVGAYETPVNCTKIAENAFNGCTKLTEISISGQVATIGKTAFKGCTGITTINFLGTKDDAPLTICEQAFYGLTNAEFVELTLPANLVKMEVNAFGGCTKLLTVSVNSVNITSFATNAFGSTAANSVFYVTTVNIAKEVPQFSITGVFGSIKLLAVNVDTENENFTTIDGVLYDKNVTAVLYYPTEKEGGYTLPSTITVVGDRVFQEKTGITSIVINKNVTKIGEGAFQNCQSLTSITFEDGGTENLVIDNQAFYQCRGLTEIVLPSRTTTIGVKAFAYCSKITSFVIPEGVTEVGDAAFNYCSLVETISIPATLTELVESTTGIVNLTDDTDPRIRLFTGCPALKNYIIANDNPTYTAIGGIIYKKIKDTVTGDVVSLELEVCPQGKQGIVDIPANVTKIRNRAFANCDEITELKFSNGISGNLDIEPYAFYYCQSLAKIELPEGLAKIGQNVFYDCEDLTEVFIPNTVSQLDVKAFGYCTKLATVTFEAGNESTPLILNDGNSTTTNSGEPVTTYYGVFYKCDSLKTLVFPARLSKIGAYSLSSLQYLESVTIPATITEIGEYAFKSDYLLTEINFVGGASQLTKIGDYAFSSCETLPSISLPEGLKEIGNYAFEYNYEINNITLPSTLETIGTSAFKYCRNLTNVTLVDTEESPSQLKNIGSMAFGSSITSYATKITSFTFPSTIETIGTYAFSYTKLETVTFKTAPKVFNATDDPLKKPYEYTENVSNLKHIGEYAFQGTAITSFAFPYTGKTTTLTPVTEKVNVGTTEEPDMQDVVTSYNAAYAYNQITFGTASVGKLFNSCKFLNSVTISENVTTIDKLFDGCSTIKNIVIAGNSENFAVDDTYPLILNKDKTSYKFFFGCVDGVVNIPVGVTEIGSYAFNGQANITKVIIPYTVNKIGNYAFQNCFSLQEVVFDRNCIFEEADIGTYMFVNCRSLEKVTLPKQFPILSADMFADCVKLNEIVLPENLYKINGYAFTHTYSLENFTIPSTVNTLAANAFLKAGFKEIVYPATITSAGAYIFQDCPNLEKITIAEGVTSLLGTFAKGCTKLTEINLPSTLAYIPSSFVAGCPITSITIPASVKTIGGTSTAAGTASTGSNSFDGCTELTTVIFEEGSQLTTIGTYAFRNCAKLTSIELPSTVKYINSSAFYGTGLTSIVLPQSLVQIGGATTFLTTTSYLTGKDGAFQACPNLATVDFSACTALTKINNLTFANNPSLTSIEFPSTITNFGSGVVACCENLESIEFKGKYNAYTTTATSTGIGKFFAASCPKLTNVTFNSNIDCLGDYMFYNCTGLETINLPSKLTITGWYTFSGSGLKSITIPDTVIGLGSQKAAGTAAEGAYLFQNCKNLESITFGAKVAYISNYCFAGCTALKSITIPNTVKAIGTYAFKECTSLETITLGTNTAFTAIPNYFAQGCSSLKQITFPAQIKTIGTYAFQNCGLTSVTIPSKVTALGTTATTSQYSFAGCKDLKTVTFAGSVTTLGGYTFQGCESLETIDLSKITIVGQYCFNGCSKLKTVNLSALKNLGNYAFFDSGLSAVTLPETCLTVGYAVFNDCDSLTSVTGNSKFSVVNNHALVETSSGTIKSVFAVAGDYDIPEGAVIGYYAFKGCANVNTVTLPTTMTAATQYAFNGFLGNKVVITAENFEVQNYSFTGSGISEIEGSENITSLGKQAFKGCTNLTNITLSNKLTTICASAFEGSGLTSIDIPATVEMLGETTTGLEKSTAATYGAIFRDCANLETVTLHDGLVYINPYTFANSGVKSIVIPSTVQFIAAYAFNGCPNLESIVFNNQYTKNNKADLNADCNHYEFANCPSLKTVTYTGRYNTINGYSFLNCTSLETINIPEGVQIIEDHSFDGCTSLKNINISSTVTLIDNFAFQGCTGLETINIPGNVNQILQGAFKGCTSLKTVVLNEGLVTIGAVPSTLGTGTATGSVFEGCVELTSINLPSTLETIGGSTFKDCTKLAEIYIPENVYYLGANVFEGWTSSQRVNVQASLYEVTGCWYNQIAASSFTNYMTGSEAVITYNYVAQNPTEN